MPNRKARFKTTNYKTMKVKTDNISVKGYSHILADKECQDSSTGWDTRDYSAVIVCDGHGGEKYIRSAIGSEVACEIGKMAIDDFMKSIKKNDGEYIRSQLPNLERFIVNNWRAQVLADNEKNPFDTSARFNSLSDGDKKSLKNNPVKAYGSTFIAAVLTDKFYFIIKLGDGNANVIYSDGTIDSPQELVDDQLQFNLTTSLCQSNAFDEFKHVVKSFDRKKSVKSIVLTTDGVINCFKSVESYHALIKNIYDAYSETKNKKDMENARNELADGLNHLSEKGSGDDLSVAIMIR